MNSVAAVESKSPAKYRGASQDHATEISDVTREARNLTDDEILGLGARSRTRKRDSSSDPSSRERAGADSEIAKLSDPWDGSPIETARNVPGPLSENPELRELRSDADAYKEAFATPADAQAAKLRLADLEVIDSLFFSQRPEDHVELTRIVEQIDPGSFELFADTIARMVGERARARGSSSEIQADPQNEAVRLAGTTKAEISRKQPASTHAIQEQFLHEANGAVVKGVLDAIESQVDRVIPEGISKTARNRLVGEIYREVEGLLGSNSDFARQIRAALQSGDLTAKHRDAIVSLVTGRARQALPSATKRVVDEWTSTMMAAYQDRRAR